MSLYKLFSCNVEITYKSCLLSKATLFTLLTTVLNILLPFIIAYRSRGFWLRTHSFYEQPLVRFTYEYLVVVETDDPSQPIVCSEASILSRDSIVGEENCVQFQVHGYDNNNDGKDDRLEFNFHLNIPPERTITSAVFIFGLDFQLQTVCPLQMQSVAMIDKTFMIPPSGLKFYGDVEFYQVTHLPCIRNSIDTKYNNSLLSYKQNNNENIVDSILRSYFEREVTTKINRFQSLSENGHIGKLKINLHLRIPEMLIKYTPSLLQELKWAWPQYLSLAIIFYWIFNKIKRFVFNNRLLMAWEIVPWKKL